VSSNVESLKTLGQISMNEEMTWFWLIVGKTLFGLYLSFGIIISKLVNGNDIPLMEEAHGMEDQGGNCLHRIHVTMS
jgi:hypothetical protein